MARGATHRDVSIASPQTPRQFPIKRRAPPAILAGGVKFTSRNFHCQAKTVILWQLVFPERLVPLSDSRSIVDSDG
jgi:hypothetical protein